MTHDDYYDAFCSANQIFWGTGNRRQSMGSLYNQHHSPPTLEGFEEVLGRKFKCTDCGYHYYYSKILKCSMGNYIGWIDGNDCDKFKLSDKTKALIKIILQDCEKRGIDLHPRYLIREEMMSYIKEEPPSIIKDFDPKKEKKIRQALFKLELIL